MNKQPLSGHVAFGSSPIGYQGLLGRNKVSRYNPPTVPVIDRLDSIQSNYVLDDNSIYSVLGTSVVSDSFQSSSSSESELLIACGTRPLDHKNTGDGLVHVSDGNGLLLIGGSEELADKGFLRRNRIKMIISVSGKSEGRSNTSHTIRSINGYKNTQIKLVRIAIPDDPNYIWDFYSVHMEMVAYYLTKSQSVLIHSPLGISRSATYCIIFLIRFGNLSVANALRKVRSARSIARPNTGFWQQCLKFESHWKQINSPAIRRKSSVSSYSSSTSSTSDSSYFCDRGRTGQRRGLRNRRKSHETVPYPQSKRNWHKSRGAYRIYRTRAVADPIDPVQVAGELVKMKKDHRRYR